MSLTQITGALNTLSNGAQRAISSAGSVARSVNSIAGSAQSLRNATTVGGALGAVTNIAGNVGNIAGNVSRVAGALSGITNPSQLGSALRSLGLPPGGELSTRNAAQAAFGGQGDADWRVKITSPIGGFTFPYTPTIALTGSAVYDEVNVTHQNYQFTFFQNGRAEQIQMSAPFNVEDAEEASYWLGAILFLRRAVKMLPGGNPPPICKLSGYGDYVLPNVPCVIKSWNVDMPQDVNYINIGGSWVPVKSTLSLTLQPVYSRKDTLNFNSLTDLVKNNKFI
jgi:hypothetical protein